MAENRIRFRADLNDKVSSQLSRIRDNFDRLGKTGGFKSLVQGVGMGVGQAAIQGLGTAFSVATDFISTSVDAARDMTETLSKSRVVFGGAAGDIESFGDSTAVALGISKQAAIDAAAGFGVFFTGVGKSQGEAAQMSKTMVTLAADLASFNNIDPTDALDKLRAGLAGEAEPLRRVGVFLTEAKVRQKAMELGLVGLNGEVSEAAKIQARYAIILEETTLAQGDASRTIDQLAGSQRSASAQLLDAQAELGRSFEPIALQVTRFQVDFLQGLQLVDEGLKRSNGGFLDWGLGIGTVIRESNAAVAGGAAGIAASGRSMGGSFDKVKDKSRDLRSAVTHDANDIGGAWKTMVDDVKSEAQKLIGDVYDPIIARDRLLRNESELTKNRRILNSATATAAEKADARAAIHQIAQDNLELRFELLAAGQLTTDEQADLFADLQTRLSKSTGTARVAIQKLIDKYLQLSRLTAPGITVRITNRSTRSGELAGERAHGGPVAPWKAYTVGEQGPETLVMGAQGGTIIPNGAGGGGSPNVIQLVVDGRVLAEVVDKQLHKQWQRAGTRA